MGSLEPYEIALTLAKPWEFNGSLALGGPNTQIGMLEADVDHDGVVDMTIPLRALDPNDPDVAYSDVENVGSLVVFGPVNRVSATSSPRSAIRPWPSQARSAVDSPKPAAL
jgi:hypothetical protein